TNERHFVDQVIINAPLVQSDHCVLTFDFMCYKDRYPEPQTWIRNFRRADFSGMRIFLDQVKLGPASVVDLYRTTGQKVHEADTMFVQKNRTQSDEPQAPQKDPASSGKEIIESDFGFELEIAQWPWTTSSIPTFVPLVGMAARRRKGGTTEMILLHLEATKCKPARRSLEPFGIQPPVVEEQCVTFIQGGELLVTNLTNTDKLEHLNGEFHIQEGCGKHRSISSMALLLSPIIGRVRFVRTKLSSILISNKFDMGRPGYVLAGGGVGLSTAWEEVLDQTLICRSHSPFETASAFSSKVSSNMSNGVLTNQHVVHHTAAFLQDTTCNPRIVSQAIITDKYGRFHLEWSASCHRYSKTQSAIQVVDSTAHAIVRGYLDFQRHEKILKLLRERAYTGVFLDEVSANLLLDHFVDAQEWSAAIEVVWELCLQDYFQSEASISPVTVALALHASKQLIQAGLAEDTFTDSSADNADEEVEYKFVKYIRNPSYDNFFDIQRPRLKLGFTLVHLSDLFSNRLDSIRLSSDAVRSLAATLYQALRLFGLAYSEQLDQLKQELEKFQTAEQLQVAGLSAVVLDKLIHAVESCQTRPDNTAPARGEPVLPTATEVDLAVEQVKRLRELCAQVVAEDFFSRCEDFIQKEVLGNVDCMRAETAAVEQLYNRFEDERNRIWTDHLVSARQRAVIETTKKSLRDLVDEEERLTYFKQSEEILHKSWLAPRSRKERRWSRLKEWQQDLLRQHGSKPHTRIGEHRRKIDRSPRKADEYRTLLKDSAIAEIALDTGQKIDVENVGVLREGLRFTSQRLMIEVVEIAKHLSINRIEGVEDGFGSVKLTRVERLLDACESSRTSKSDVINQKTCKAPASDVKDPRFK
ncbi:hypothetical protein CLF_104102, partial [Clonorchis sinensis]